MKDERIEPEGLRNRARKVETAGAPLELKRAMPNDKPRATRA